MTHATGIYKEQQHSKKQSRTAQGNRYTNISRAHTVLLLMHAEAF